MEHGTEIHPELIARTVILHEGKILLCRQKGNRHYFLPGGHIEFGEHTLMSIQREFIEELGVDITDISFIGAAENVYERNGIRVHEMNLVFSVKMSRITSQSLEDHIEFAWIDSSTLIKEIILPLNLKNAVICWLEDKMIFFASQTK